ncbi:conserved phage C-terminal domain-containing protein [Lactococcus ileimucosae]|uniref:conserved phage C-terminal domain-containing protein n=1 Tax=Lactococcus ileimucosae TaxID=2941329 RepID=UPI003514D2CD
MQSIQRKRAGDNFTILSNEFLRDENLSLKAKGLLSYILSLPDNWKIYFEEISNHHTDSAKAVRLAWKELEEHGYAKTTRVVDPKNKQVKQWKKEVSDFKNPDYQKPHVENPQCGKGHLLNTNILITDLTKNNMSGKPDKTIPYSEIINYLNEKTGRAFKNVEANKKLIRARWNEGYRIDDFKTVIDNMIFNWKGKKFNGVPAENYLQPKTLFSNKFDNYLNQKPVIKAQNTSLYEEGERPF